MDEPFLPKTTQKDTYRSSSSWREFPSGYLDPITNNDALIPVVKTPNASPSPSYVNLLSSLNKNRRKLPHRSHSAPPIFTDAKGSSTNFLDPRPTPKSTPVIVWQAFIGVILYLLIVVVTFLVSGKFKGTTTSRPVDALYFTVVTLCTIGFGDIIPDSTFTKLLTCVFILVGFGFIDILLNGLVTYICDRQEAVLLSAVDENRFNTMVQAYVIDRAKGRMRIRTKVCLALVVVFGCIAIGTIAVHFLESLSWVDSFYLSVTSVTTVGYGDYAFTTITGRCFAIVWLLISTLAVARAFLYLAELRIDKRNRIIAKWVLQKKMTLGDLVAADLDNDGSISKSEFIIYKLKEMGKITEKDILLICNQFDIIDNSNCGKITLAGLMEAG
ncbi:two pore potassium channel c [Ricinus communis]|uniref:Calcium-activated outward-rectifying potassium channel, putative n=1 Tax=Ricinus communis TaxID=3988 RepID=B9T748_RICCO|nr:two pore potassium channel c [Ricinus communis]EEF28311.1 Calcium-activated outward-rectifying potassium channel, putative [Ricinus communis]|eukprot:XP_002534067.1 two pore potassium channel c [Ricinus communis]